MLEKPIHKRTDERRRMRALKASESATIMNSHGTSGEGGAADDDREAESKAAVRTMNDVE